MSGEAEGLSAAIEMPTGAIVQTHKRRRARRNHQRVDELEPLHPTPAPSAPPAIIRLTLSKTVHEISFCLFRLNLYTLETFPVASFGSTKSTPLFNSESDWRDWYDFKQIVGEEIVSSKDDDIYDGQLQARFRLFLDRRSNDLLLERLYDTRTCRYYTKMLKLCILLYRTAQSKERHAKKGPNLSVLENESLDESPGVHLAHLITEVNSTRQRLTTVVKEIRTLCDCINAASEGGELDKASLKSLKTNMIALQVYFHEACKQLGELPYSPIASSGGSQWWHSETEIFKSSYTSQTPAAAVQAYKDTSNINATLTFLVPTISLISCIPAALAWTYSLPHVGKHHDADFYQLISSSTVQLLGLLTLIWPTIAHKRLASHAWLWTWVLASASALFTVLAVPLYLILPTRWSALLSFSGSIAQILVLLQLVYTI